MAKILVNYPSRSRPHKFFKTLRSYIDKSSGNHEIRYLIKVDADDVTMNNDRVRTFVTRLGSTCTFVVLKDCKGKIDAINRDVAEQDFDIVVCIADDIDVVDNNWDETIVSDFAGNYDQAINYNCDKRVEDFRTLIILPIIGRQLFDRFGYVYHSDYVSEWCDNEQTEVFASLGKLNHIDRKIFVHDWWGNQDALMSRNVGIGQSVDAKTFLARKALNFV